MVHTINFHILKKTTQIKNYNNYYKCRAPRYRTVIHIQKLCQHTVFVWKMTCPRLVLSLCHFIQRNWELFSWKLFSWKLFAWKNSILIDQSRYCSQMKNPVNSMNFIRNSVYLQYSLERKKHKISHTKTLHFNMLTKF